MISEETADGERQETMPSSDAAAAEDARLMLRVRDGDEAAFAEIVARHQQMIFGTAAKMLGSLSDAEDIVQMVFIRAWKAAPRYEPTAKLTTWLLTITRNLVFNEVRRRGNARIEPLEENANEHEDSAPRQIGDNTQRAADEILHEREVTTAVDAAIAALPPNARMAMLLRRRENMPYEEIAQVLGLSLPNVKTLIFRARAELKISLAKYL